ncbi:MULTISPECIES: hypothetical protein [Trichocoleus]|uniref:Uncharacterized protein n=1 Tax=Trichocoleus desertorum GB2-A4 TaxID=2933944 RepID=A0ABV0JCX3_9CYAN|nr:hypothetical protein [Trichocoleus sp. FACHB-46]MBD1864286.1 hypothetical protein [Trichocoleus sp. FACHB-46]
MTNSLPLLIDVEPNIIFTNAWFGTDTHQPAVYWQLNQKNGLLTLVEARARAQAIFQAVAYAEGEAAIVKGVMAMHLNALKSTKKGFGAQAQEQKQSAEMEALIMAAQLRRFLQQGRSPLIEGIEVIFGMKTRRALIDCTWYGELTQWETTQAIEHATILIETAEAAESDAYFRWFLMERVGIEAEETYPLIAEFQTFRQRRQLEELFEAGNH